MRKSGQSTLEYVVLIIIIVSALVVMASYLKRGLSAKIKDSAEQVSGPGAFYEPGKVKDNPGGKPSLHINRHSEETSNTEDLGTEESEEEKKTLTKTHVLLRQETERNEELLP